MSGADDPRVRMAAERTLLAWIRTGVAVMALGFVLARHEPTGPLAVGLGGGLVLLGAAFTGLVARQYSLLLGGLAPADRPGRGLATMAVWFAAALAVVGLVLAASIFLHPESRPGPP